MPIRRQDDSTAASSRDHMRVKFPRIEMFELVKSAHAGQFRNNGRVPYWMHLQASAEILEWGFIGSQEIRDEELRDDLYTAALGHDLYEDTTIRCEEIVARFGPRVDAWIQVMTNDGDDKDKTAYMARLAAGPEEARLIKLADLIENMASCTYAIPDMGLEWTRNFFFRLQRKLHRCCERHRLPPTGRPPGCCVSRWSSSWTAFNPAS